MIYLLFLVILGNFLLGLKYTPKSNPIIIFTIGFLAASCVSLFYFEEWSLSRFHESTTYLLGGGITCFSLTCLYVNKRLRSKYSLKAVSPLSYNVKNSLMFWYLVGELLVQYWYYRNTMSYSSGNNLGEALVEINVDTLSNGLEYKVPLLLRNLRLLVEAITYYMLLVLANLLVEKQYKKTFWPFTICIVGVMGEFLSSSRSGSMNMIVFFFVCYSIIDAKKNRKKIEFTFKKLLSYVLIGVMSISFFVKSTEWIGREIGDYGALYYLSFYCGAEIKNLDSFVNEKRKESPAFGCYTFHNFYSDSFLKKHTEKLTVFRSEGAYPMGNVYTCFQKYYQDFGMIGSFIMVAIMAIIMQLLFMRALHSKDLDEKVFDFKIFLYGFMSTHLIMSFFSDRFYNSLTTGTLKLIIEAVIFGYVFEKYFRIKKRKVNIYEKAIDNCNSDV